MLSSLKERQCSIFVKELKQYSYKLINGLTCFLKIVEHIFSLFYYQERCFRSCILCNHCQGAEAGIERACKDSNWATK